ncbi:MAG: energy transducer TonB [Kiritimatiellaeota bacterium]|nr:energy transducer TonB [Kiritimatiellota bacterium]
MEHTRQSFPAAAEYPPTRSHGADVLLTLAALVFTLLLFLVLPLSELLSPAPQNILKIREVDATTWKPPAPPRVQLPRPPRPRPKAVVVRPKLPAPKLRPRREPVRPRLRLPANLALGPSMPVGDFDLDFQVRPAAPAAGAAAAVPAKTVFGSNEVDRPPRPVVQVPPVYPYQARLRRIEGFVDVRFTVLRDGSVADIQTVAAQPKETFVRAATAAVARWRFEPGRKNGEPTPTRMQVRIRFELRR